jgi:transcriptional regulator with XRE-family HTH domain
MNIEYIDMPDVHVGNMILDYLNKNRITQAELARGLKLDSSYLHRLLVKKSMETDRLLEICYALSYNFFPAFCNDTKAYENGTSFGHVELGTRIEKRLKEIEMTQVEFADKLGVSQSEVSRLLRKTSFETDKLTLISRLLGYNFFHDFYTETPNSKEDEFERLHAYTMKRYEELVIENDRQRQEIETQKKEIAYLKGKLAEAGIEF